MIVLLGEAVHPSLFIIIAEALSGAIIKESRYRIRVQFSDAKFLSYEPNNDSLVFQVMA